MKYVVYLCIRTTPDCQYFLGKQVRLWFLKGEICFVDVHIIALLFNHETASVLLNTDGGRQMAGLTDRQRVYR